MVTEAGNAGHTGENREGLSINIDEMQAGREMDALVAEKIMGFTVRYVLGRYQVALFDVETKERVPGIFKTLPHYSTDIAAAMEVVGNLYSMPNTKIEISWGSMINPREILVRIDRGQVSYGVADTLPLAICRAALKVVMGRD